MKKKRSLADVYHQATGLEENRIYEYRGRKMKQTWVQMKCFSCDNLIWRERSALVRGGRKTESPRFVCSGACKKKAYPRKRQIFKLGDHGYIMTDAPDHPNANKDGRHPEHRLVMERKVGRILSKKELVHHIDCGFQNNKIGNLIIMDQKQHRVAHASIVTLVGELLRNGHIVFNRKKMIYERP